MTEQDYGSKNQLIVRDKGNKPETQVQLMKEYKTETPINGIIDKLEEKYESVELNKVAFKEEDGGVSVMSDPILSADREGEVYPENVSMTLDDGTTVRIEQTPILDPKAYRGEKLGEDEDYEEDYHLNLTIRGPERENTEEAFKTIYGECKDALEEFSQSELVARQVQASDIYNGQSQGRGQSETKTDLEELEQQYGVEVEGYTWDDIALPEDIKDQVENLVEGPMKNPELFEKMGERPQGIALYGEPGVGKTLLAKVISSETDADMYSAKVSDLTNKYVGQSAQNAEDLFQMVKENTSEESPSILFFDEADSLFKDRSGDSSHDEYRDMVNTILSNMDGLQDDMDNLMVIAATNDVEGMDDASIREGRFDARIEVPTPNNEARERIFEIHTTQQDDDLYEDDVDLSELAESAESFTGAEIMGAVKDAKINVMNELKEEYKDIASIPPEEFTVGQEDLKSAVKDKKQDVLNENNGKIGFEG